MKENREENFYELLQINPHASTSEIVAAYHRVKNTFSKDNLATYSLFSGQEIEKTTEKIEKAYQTLSNLDKRHAYDKKIKILHGEKGARALLEEFDHKNKTSHLTHLQPQKPSDIKPEKKIILLEKGDGEELKKIRENLGHTLEEVSQNTKIQAKQIESIENQKALSIMARVYLQGYLKTLAKFYGVDPENTVKLYFSQNKS